MTKKIPTKVIEKIKKLNQDGYSHIAIAEIVGLGKSTVGRYARTDPARTRKPNVRLTDEHRRQCLRLYEDGQTIRAIGDKLGISRMSVSKALTDANKILPGIKKTKPEKTIFHRDAPARITQETVITIQAYKPFPGGPICNGSSMGLYQGAELKYRN